MQKPENGFASAAIAFLLRPLIRRWDNGSTTPREGRLPIPGLKDEVRVFWGPYGVPHVVASNERDLFLSQGFLHASERLWQMDLNRRLFSGRLAEIFGAFTIPWKDVSIRFRDKNTADLDYFMRLIGARRNALSSLRLLTEADRDRLQAYSEGVNRYLENYQKRLPWEFRLLRYEPEPWSPVDTLTVTKGFAFLLSTSFFTRLCMTAIAACLGHEKELFASLCPFYPEDGPSVTRAVAQISQGLWSFANGTFHTVDWIPESGGSNNWVIAPHRSTSGAAILCNDPHLRMTLPSTWYLMHLKALANLDHSDGYEVWGASIPGSPCIHLGHNRWIAWGVTAALCDDAELYREEIHPQDPHRYRSAQDWQPMHKQEEEIKIRGKATIKKTLRFTRRGPVISDLLPFDRQQEEVLSLKWTAQDPSEEFRTVYGVNCARNWREFLEALAYQSAPTLNYVYADRQGNIGYTLAGKVPIRPHRPSLLPLEGWREENEWRGYVPFRELPRIYNPPEGITATANNRIADPAYPYYLSDLFEPPYRIRRITELLTTKEKWSAHDMAAVQLDVLSLHAKDLLESLKTELREAARKSPRLETAADALLTWNGEAREDSTGAAIFYVFHYRLMANLLIPILGDDLFLGYLEIFNQCLAPVDEIIKSSATPWFVSCSRGDLVEKSLDQACAELTQSLGADPRRWQWGRLHALTIGHALGAIKFLKPLLSIGPFPTPGDGVTVNMGFYRRSAPYRHTVGASLRMIIELSERPQSNAILSSGQSGHPFSPHYQDQTELWRAGEYLSLTVSAEEVKTWPLLSLRPYP